MKYEGIINLVGLLLLAAPLTMGSPMKKAEDPHKEFLGHFESLVDRELRPRAGFGEYLAANVNVRRDGEWLPFSFEGGHEELRVFVELQDHPDIVCRKAVQRAFSTVAMARNLWKALGTALSVAWYFPHTVAMKRFVQTRFDMLVEHSPKIRKHFADSDLNNVTTKQYGRALIFFLATSTEDAVRTVDADFTIEDEVDAHTNQERREQIHDRRDASTLNWHMAGSQPTLPDLGIDAAFKESDQRYFIVRCHRGHSNNLVLRVQDDPEKLFGRRKGEVFYRCHKCDARLNAQKGKHVAQFRDRKRAGIQLSQLHGAAPAEKYYDLLQRAKGSSEKLRVLYRSKFGVAYADSEEQPVTDQVLESARGEHGLFERANYWTYFGCDQGDTVHMLAGEPTEDGRIKIVGIGAFSIFNRDVHTAFIKNFQVYRGWIDAGPNKNWSGGLALEFQDNLGIQYFTKNFALKDEVLPDTGGLEVRVLNVNRDNSLDETVSALKNGRFILPDPQRLTGPALALSQMLDFHLKNLVRERAFDADGNVIMRFKKQVPNHLGMALNSLRLAADNWVGGAGSDYLPTIGR